MKKSFVSACFALLLVCACSQAEEIITAQELSIRIQENTAPLILDVRTVGEYTASHIPGAKNIPHTQLKERLAELGIGKSDEVIVHCQAGPRAGIAQNILEQAGFTNVVELQGHMAGWLEGDYPVE